MYMYIYVYIFHCIVDCLKPNSMALLAHDWLAVSQIGSGIFDFGPYKYKCSCNLLNCFVVGMCWR